MRIGIAMAALVALGMSVDAWVMLSGAPAVEIRFWPAASGMRVPPDALPLIGFVAGVAIACLGAAIIRAWRSVTGGDTPAVKDSSGQIWAASLGVVWVGLTALLIGAVVLGELKAVLAACVLVCGSLALLGAVSAFDNLRSGHAVEFSSYWGGLGGGMGGWRLSPVTTTIILTLVFLGTLVAITIDKAPLSDGSASGSNVTTPARGRNA